MTNSSSHEIVHSWGLPLGYSVRTYNPLSFHLFRTLECGSMVVRMQRRERMRKMTSSQSRWTAGRYLQTASSWTPCSGRASLERCTRGWSRTVTSTILTSRAQSVWQSRSSDVSFAAIAHLVSLCVYDCACLLVQFVAEANAALKSDFLKEIATMKKITMGNCPYVVNMVGCCTLQEPLALVLEYIPNGDLLTYLRTIRKLVSNLNTVTQCTYIHRTACNMMGECGISAQFLDHRTALRIVVRNEMRQQVQTHTRLSCLAAQSSVECSWYTTGLIL